MTTTWTARYLGHCLPSVRHHSGEQNDQRPNARSKPHNRWKMAVDSAADPRALHTGQAVLLHDVRADVAAVDVERLQAPMVTVSL